jgi:hypothetical protein
MWKVRMASVCPQIIPLVLAIAEVSLAGITPILSQERDSLQRFESCTVITTDQARLDCLKKLLPKASSDAAPADEGTTTWRLIRTPRPNGGSDAMAIMRTADTTRSDPDLAGLMIRCQEKLGMEVVLALVRPFPPRSKRDVVVNLGTTETILHAETSPAGTALVLPIDATAFTTGPFRELSRLSIKINDPEGDIRGATPLDGIGPAIASLSANCLSR